MIAKKNNVAIKDKKEDEAFRFKCTMCGNGFTDHAHFFFKTRSQLYEKNNKYLSICKYCTMKLFEKYKSEFDELKALYYWCRKLDIFFDNEIYQSINEFTVEKYLELVNQPEYMFKCFDDSADISNKEIERLNSVIEMLSEEPEKYQLSGKNDKIYSAEWMGNYTLEELDYLNNYYKGLNNDYKITTENHKDYARKIAQASLYMNQCFQDVIQKKTDITAYTKARETFDTLSRSAKFSEQTRGINDVSLGGYGVTAELVEKHEWIPRHTVIKKDDVDKLIEYFSTIQESL